MSQEAISASVVARIRLARRQRGMSVQALAEAITACGFQISRVSIAKAEAGIRETIPVDLVVHAARVLSVPVVRLLVDDAWCSHCNDAPPTGFVCKECGAEA